MEKKKYLNLLLNEWTDGVKSYNLFRITYTYIFEWRITFYKHQILFQLTSLIIEMV